MGSGVGWQYRLRGDAVGASLAAGGGLCRGGSLHVHATAGVPRRGSSGRRTGAATGVAA